jgi:hypothetical protein
MIDEHLLEKIYLKNNLTKLSSGERGLKQTRNSLFSHDYKLNLFEHDAIPHRNLINHFK